MDFRLGGNDEFFYGRDFLSPFQFDNFPLFPRSNAVCAILHSLNVRQLLALMLLSGFSGVMFFFQGESRANFS